MGQDDPYRITVSIATTDLARCSVFGGTGAFSGDVHCFQPTCLGGAHLLQQDPSPPHWSWGTTVPMVSQG